jgi:hypothetical protein
MALKQVKVKRMVDNVNMTAIVMNKSKRWIDFGLRVLYQHVSNVIQVSCQSPTSDDEQQIQSLPDERLYQY